MSAKSFSSLTQKQDLLNETEIEDKATKDSSTESGNLMEILSYVKSIDKKLTQQTSQLNSKILSHEVRINQNAKDITEASFKFEKVFKDHFNFPGVVGQFCKYKSLNELIHYFMNQITNLSNFKEKALRDIEVFQHKINEVYKEMNFKTETFTKNQISMSQSFIGQMQKDFYDNMTDLKHKLSEYKIENESKYIMLKDEIKKIVEVAQEKENEELNKKEQKMQENISKIQNDLMALASQCSGVFSRYKKHSGGESPKKRNKNILTIDFTKAINNVNSGSFISAENMGASLNESNNIETEVSQQTGVKDSERVCPVSEKNIVEKKEEKSMNLSNLKKTFSSITHYPIKAIKRTKSSKIKNQSRNLSSEPKGVDQKTGDSNQNEIPLISLEKSICPSKRNVSLSLLKFKKGSIQEKSREDNEDALLNSSGEAKLEENGIVKKTKKEKTNPESAQKLIKKRLKKPSGKAMSFSLKDSTSLQFFLKKSSSEVVRLTESSGQKESKARIDCSPTNAVKQVHFIPKKKP